MWGTSSPDDKLTGDLGNVIESTQIGGRRSDRLTAGKLSPGNFGLLQQYRHKADMTVTAVEVRFRGQSATLENKPERGPDGDPLRPVPGVPPCPRRGHAVRTARSWRGIVAFTHPRTGGAHDSHHRTAGIAGRTRRRGGGVAARRTRAAGRKATDHRVLWPEH